MAFQYALGSAQLSAPNGAVIGLVGEDRGTQSEILLAAGEDARCYDHPSWSPLEARRQLVAMDAARRSGQTILLASYDPSLLRQCDELWWVEPGTLRAQGDPRSVWREYSAYAAEEFLAWGSHQEPAITPAFRSGDGRARLVEIAPLGETGEATQVWRSGAPAAVRVVVEFHQRVDSPVVGIMIRSRVGMEVYGTNTELEEVKLGPVDAGDRRTIEFAFACRLCPNDYTITAASHDPDGTWHDWLEDAVAVSVAGTRYTAGVADLSAQVTVRAS